MSRLKLRPTRRSRGSACKTAARNSGGGVLREYDNSKRGDTMKAQRRKFQGKVVATVMTVLVGSGVGTGIHAKGRGEKGANQETEASREKNAQSTTLSDQTELNVTVYN